jgi:hypothetical protein
MQPDAASRSLLPSMVVVLLLQAAVPGLAPAAAVAVPALQNVPKLGIRNSLLALCLLVLLLMQLRAANRRTRLKLQWQHQWPRCMQLLCRSTCGPSCCQPYSCHCCRLRMQWACWAAHAGPFAWLLAPLSAAVLAAAVAAAVAVTAAALWATHLHLLLLMTRTMLARRPGVLFQAGMPPHCCPQLCH